MSANDPNQNHTHVLCMRNNKNNEIMHIINRDQNQVGQIEVQEKEE